MTITKIIRRQIILHFIGERHECGNQCNICPVSQFAVEEFEVLQNTLTLERDLRTEAENFARAVSFYMRNQCFWLFSWCYFVLCVLISYVEMSIFLGILFRWWLSKSNWRGRVRSWCRALRPVTHCKKPLTRSPNWLRILRPRGWNTRTRSV